MIFFGSIVNPQVDSCLVKIHRNSRTGGRFTKGCDGRQTQSNAQVRSLAALDSGYSDTAEFEFTGVCEANLSEADQINTQIRGFTREYIYLRIKVRVERDLATHTITFIHTNYSLISYNVSISVCSTCIFSFHFEFSFVPGS
mmetsp:Transcript_5479/g.20518  ORF Transcript_5479/g.20518 Transcript_5479/m.20518 type:complete len:142 (-) Transcript_5479:2445-2870(-)